MTISEKAIIFLSTFDDIEPQLRLIEKSNSIEPLQTFSQSYPNFQSKFVQLSLKVSNKPIHLAVKLHQHCPKTQSYIPFFSILFDLTPYLVACEALATTSKLLHRGAFRARL
jgi:hypothetical protein